MPDITDDADVVDQVEFWLDVLDAADAVHVRLPATVRDEVDAGAGTLELTRLIGPMAMLSTPTRNQLRVVLLGLLGRDLARRSAGSGVGLRLVGG